MHYQLQELDIGGAGDGDLHVDADGEGDDHGTVAVDALDDALDILEGAGGETDATVEVGDGQATIGIGALTIGVVDSGGPDDVLHGSLSDGDNLGTAVKEMTAHILQGGAGTVEHLHPGNATLEGIDEQEVVDGWAHLGTNRAATLHMEGLHRNKCAEIVGVQLFLDGQLLAVLDVHGIPMVVLGRAVCRQRKGTSARISDTSTQPGGCIVFSHTT